MVLTANGLENLTLEIRKEMQVNAPLPVTFEAVLDEMGPCNEKPDGEPMPMKLEPWPGGRWYRDLGGDNGHFWGHVQAIKRPTLIEICGPLFASSPFISNVQYRLKESGDGTLLVFHHTALGFIEDEQREGAGQGWSWILDRIRNRAEARR